ncbi:MAG TPA: hypothetical protein VLA52_10865 [Thermohalobaculum sp.]|nr:hypothetical protein [Thermohalobaculum sp.]
MFRRMFLAAAIAAAASPGWAQAVRLTAAEIEALLSGNTIRGTWNGDLYKQFFSASGRTIYAPRHSRSTAGKWRVNPETDSYESWWEMSGWAAYGIIRDGDALFWTTESGPPQPFEVLPGEQLAWTE